ncbi:exodeoxyribonuclease III [Kangiella profundi]|uniref:Exodeoxyribonuclease III n=1 Tax=Kangiella profundi TaxID=1561924 RepID=A0A2K9ANH8_9GAMM|nr:exodeoxyribonuclease III [Kangiella profundi]AUD79172.1 exodeoxyribonuclease III [Kangiella profundi]GGF00896.1 exodeoxyribonuclease III [Kangiella profundi]
MKIVTFNINSIRTRVHQIEALVEKHDPDIICIQETKVHDDAFPFELYEHLGYHIEIHGGKAHYGVATFSKQKPLAVEKGFPTDPDDAQRRMIITSFQYGDEVIKVLNGYFPQGENRDHPVKFPYKQKFYADLLTYLQNDKGDHRTIVLGDINISPEDIDIGIGEPNRKRWLRDGKCSFLPEEREWLQKILATGLHDTYRTINPDVADKFSWFDYRSRGFEREPKRGLRIDSVFACDWLNDRAIASDIDYEIRSMERPSDHAPVWTEFDLNR